MNQTASSLPVLSNERLLEQWQGHRSLTRRVIEAFPESELFTFSIGGMRPFAEIVRELLAIAAPGLKEIIAGAEGEFDENSPGLDTKAGLLEAWDHSTVQINQYWPMITPERFHETHNLFGQYSFPVIDNIFYFIDNEIHHRGQGYVYLRALGIAPPFFWER